MSPRQLAMQAILAVRLPEEWTGPERRQGEWQVSFWRWPKGAGLGRGVICAQPGLSPGAVIVRSGGIEIRTDVAGLQAAVDHVLLWIDRKTT